MLLKGKWVIDDSECYLKTLVQIWIQVFSLLLRGAVPPTSGRCCAFFLGFCVFTTVYFMRATLDTVMMCNRMLQEFSIPAATVASLAGLTRAKLCRYLNESESLGGQHDLAVRQACENLKRLILFVQPLPLNFAKHGELRRAIELMQSGKLRVVVLDLENEQ